MPPYTLDMTWDDSKSCSSCVLMQSKNAPCAVSMCRRTVTFASQINVQEIPHLKDIPKEEVHSTWYDNTDFENIKKSIIVTIRMMMANKPIGDDQCTRGLEFRTPAGAKLRKKNKLEALTAVWNEQVAQWQAGVTDDEAIREVYVRATAPCQDTALRAGAHDAKDVQNYLGIADDRSESERALIESLTAGSKQRREIVRDDLKQLVCNSEKQPRRSSCSPAAA